MDLVRCENGHFYDKEKFSTCPHCSGGASAGESMTTAFSSDLPPTEAMDMNAGMPQPAPMMGAAPSPMPAMDAPGAGGLPVAPGFADQVTEAMEMPQAMPSPNDGMGIPTDIPTMPMFGAANADVEDEDDDHTMAFFDDLIPQEAEPKKTVSTDAGMAGVTAPHNASAGKKKGGERVSTPCVGWLIALGGSHVGTDFRLKVGKNFIGRGSDMDIALTDDHSVSRVKHAVVVYEPKQHLYLVQPGEASSLVYLNNEVVLSPTQLSAYDMITLGDVNLLFMPLCGEKFSWSDLLEKKGQ